MKASLLHTRIETCFRPKQLATHVRRFQHQRLQWKCSTFSPVHCCRSVLKTANVSAWRKRVPPPPLRISVHDLINETEKGVSKKIHKEKNRNELSVRAHNASYLGIISCPKLKKLRKKAFCDRSRVRTFRANGAASRMNINLLVHQSKGFLAQWRGCFFFKICV